MKRYLATSLMCLIEKGYFGLSELFGQYAMRAASMGALLMIWRALSLGGADLGDMTLNQLYVYTVLSTALGPMLDVRTPASDWLHDGTMLSLYLRPASVVGQLIAHTLGGWAMRLLMLSAPVLIVAALLGVDMKPAGWTFLPSLLLSISQGFAVDMLFAALMIRLRSLSWPVHSLRESLTALLTGALIPFSALPFGIGRWLELMPLGTLAGAPLALYAGLGDAGRLLPAQLLWNALLWPLAAWCFRRSRERMVSYGG